MHAPNQTSLCTNAYRPTRHTWRARTTRSVFSSSRVSLKRVNQGTTTVSSVTWCVATGMLLRPMCEAASTRRCSLSTDGLESPSHRSTCLVQLVVPLQLEERPSWSLLRGERWGGGGERERERCLLCDPDLISKVDFFGTKQDLMLLL